MNSPTLRGVPIIQELRAAKETAHLPVVGLCGHLEGDRQRMAMEAGCVGTASHAEAITRLKHLVLEFTGNERVNIP
jgi:CheY-like chemotaxis protein